MTGIPMPLLKMACIWAYSVLHTSMPAYIVVSIKTRFWPNKQDLKPQWVLSPKKYDKYWQEFPIYRYM